MKSLIKSTLMTLISATLLQASVSSDYSTLYFAEDSELNSYDVKAAIYWELDEKGNILTLQKITDEFFLDDSVIIEDRISESKISHLTVYLRNGKRIDYNIKDNELIPLRE